MDLDRKLSSARERREAYLAGELTARKRAKALFDEGTFVETDALSGGGATGVVTGYGLVDGRSCYVYAQEPSVRGGALGAEQAKKIGRIYDLALQTGAPVVALLDSCGARLDEGMTAVNAYATILQKAAALSGVVPQVTAVLGMCAGGAAMCAMLSDLIVIAPDGRLFLNTPGLREAAGQKAENTAEASAKNGAAHLLASSEADALQKTRDLIAYMPGNNLEESPYMTSDAQPKAISADAKDARDVMNAISDEPILELSASYEDGVVTAFGRVGGETVGFVGTQYAKDAGKLTVGGCKKAARFVRLLDSFSLPLVTIVNCEGSAVAACEACSMKAAATLAAAYAASTAPRVALVTGKAVSTAAAALVSRAAADLTYAWPEAVITPMGAPAAAQLLYADELAKAKDPIARRAELEAKYEDEIANALAAAERGDIDDVIEPEDTRKVVADALSLLSGKRVSQPAKKHGGLPL